MMLLEKLTPRERKAAYITAGLIIFMIGFHGIWAPLKTRSQFLQDEIFATKMKLRKALIYVQHRDKVLEEARKYLNLEQLDAKKDEEEIASLLNFIEQEARESAVTLIDVKPQQVNSDRTSKRYIVNLETEGGLKEMTQFMYDLQYSPQMLRIERVEIAPKEAKSEMLRSSLTVARVVVK